MNRVSWSTSQDEEASQPSHSVGGLQGPEDLVPLPRIHDLSAVQAVLALAHVSVRVSGWFREPGARMPLLGQLGVGNGLEKQVWEQGRDQACGCLDTEY